jgi:hypothetical protein
MRRRAMSAATISRPHSPAPPSVDVPVPLYTRHTLGAIEAARDRRLQARDRSVHRYSSGDAPRVAALSLVPPSSESEGDEIDRWADEGGHFAPAPPNVAALARIAPAS